MELIEPNETIITEYVKRFKADERYSLADKIIRKLIEKFPSNNKLSDILVKVSVINELYSTNVFATFKLSQHIKSIKIDDLIKKGNPVAIEKIATGHEIKSSRTNKEIYFYSFATKYCNWHNQEAFPIYDKFVDQILMAYKKQNKFSIFEKTDLRKYKEFIRIITDFKSYFKISRRSLKEIDKFLWMYGKEIFLK